VVPNFFWRLPWPRPLPILVQNVVFNKLVPKQSCVPNLKLLASMVAKIRRGSQFFSDVSLAQTPPILVLNVVFAKLVLNPTCVPHLNLLASTVAEIRRGSQIFWMLP